MQLHHRDSRSVDPGLAERWNWTTDMPDVPWPEVGFGVINSPLGVFQAEFVVYRLAEFLLAAEITFGGLNRCMSK